MTYPDDSDPNDYMPQAPRPAKPDAVTTQQPKELKQIVFQAMACPAIGGMHEPMTGLIDGTPAKDIPIQSGVTGDGALLELFPCRHCGYVYWQTTHTFKKEPPQRIEV